MKLSSSHNDFGTFCKSVQMFEMWLLFFIKTKTSDVRFDASLTTERSCANLEIYFRNEKAQSKGNFQILVIDAHLQLWNQLYSRWLPWLIKLIKLKILPILQILS